MTIQEQILNQVDKLSINERLLIVESIWDSILSAQNSISVSEQQKSELDKRYADFKDNPDNKSTWEDAKKRIKSQI